MSRAWVVGAFATGPVNQWGGSTAIIADISASDPQSGLPQDVLYLFGTDFGAAAWSNPLDGVRCAVSASSHPSSTPPERLGDRTANYFQTNNAPGSWIVIDFDPGAAGVRVNLDAFAWQHVPDFSNSRLQFLVVESGTGPSVGGATWSTVATISDTNFLPNTTGGWSDVLALTERPDPYRFVRVRSTGLDSSGFNNFVGSEVILGGEVFGVG
ncbi:MAG: hypothetical protein AAGF75_03880 [Cyanobacteria bacterium P01_H01_bin.130]